MLGGNSSHPSSEPSSSSSPLHPQDGLEKYLLDHLRIPAERSTGSRLQFHVVSDHFFESDWKDVSLPSAFISPKEYLKTRHLIFVSQFQPVHLNSPGSARTGDAMAIVLGLCVVEYALRGEGAPSRCYIQYVDTTGLVRPRSLQSALTRSLLRAYLGYARDILHVSFVHLFASPKPSLLFAGSEAHGKKALLNGRQLISWWLALLTETFLEGDAPATLFAYAPGEESLPASTRHTRHCVERLHLRYQGRMLGFHYGVPYRGDESALETVPAFQDDPKWRHLEALLDAPHETHNSRKRQKREPAHSSLTVREFFETLCIRSDFAKDPSALICVQFHQNEQMMSFDPSFSKRSEAATSILSLLKNLTFETDYEATKSSARLVAILKMMGVPSYSIGHDSTEGADMGCKSRFKEIISALQPATDASGTRSEAHNTSAPIVDLQGLIKRKAPRSHV